MQRIGDQVAERPGVHSVDLKASTGSMVVQYDANSLSADSLLAVLHDVGLLFYEVGSEAEGLGPIETGPSRPSSSIISALEDLDRRLAASTGRKVDLKTLFPLGLGLLGLRRLSQSGLGLGELPAFVLLWYAFDSFYKLHSRSVGADQAATSSPNGFSAEPTGASEAPSGD